jgi:hypothetical protein
MAGTRLIVQISFVGLLLLLGFLSIINLEIHRHVSLMGYDSKIEGKGDIIPKLLAFKNYVRNYEINNPHVNISSGDLFYLPFNNNVTKDKIVVVGSSFQDEVVIIANGKHLWNCKDNKTHSLHTLQSNFMSSLKHSISNSQDNSFPITHVQLTFVLSTDSHEISEYEKVLLNNIISLIQKELSILTDYINLDISIRYLPYLHWLNIVNRANSTNGNGDRELSTALRNNVFRYNKVVDYDDTQCDSRYCMSLYFSLHSLLFNIQYNTRTDNTNSSQDGLVFNNNNLKIKEITNNKYHSVIILHNKINSTIDTSTSITLTQSNILIRKLSDIFLRNIRKNMNIYDNNPISDNIHSNNMRNISLLLRSCTSHISPNRAIDHINSVNNIYTETSIQEKYITVLTWLYALHKKSLALYNEINLEIHKNPFYYSPYILDTNDSNSGFYTSFRVILRRVVSKYITTSELINNWICPLNIFKNIQISVIEDNFILFDNCLNDIGSMSQDNHILKRCYDIGSNTFLRLKELQNDKKVLNNIPDDIHYLTAIVIPFWMPLVVPILYGSYVEVVRYINKSTTRKK